VLGGLPLDHPVDRLSDHRILVAGEDLLVGLEVEGADHSGDVGHRTGHSHMAEDQVGDLVVDTARSSHRFEEADMNPLYRIDIVSVYSYPKDPQPMS